jgi:hypothetical protein
MGHLPFFKVAIFNHTALPQPRVGAAGQLLNKSSLLHHVAEDNSTATRIV